MSEAGPIIVKRKKVMAAPHHGGSWKVAYADFVTAMMAFFMVMWIMGMDAETRSMVAGYFNDPMGFIKNPPKSRSPFTLPGSPAPKMGMSGKPDHKSQGPDDSDVDKLREIKKNIEDAAKKGASGELNELLEHFTIELTDEGLRLELVESVGAVFFNSGQSTILSGARALIHEIGPVIAASERKLIIEGHTDAQPYGGTSYTNLDLSQDRAQSLYHALMDDGVPMERFNEVRGYGDKKLKNKADPLHFSNRRVTILLPFKNKLGEFQDLPADAFKNQVQAVFKTNVDVAPIRPDIKAVGKAGS